MRLLPFEYAVRNLGRSRPRLAASLLGSALLVLLLLAAAAFVRGMERCLTMRGTNANVLLMSAGSEDSIERSQVEGGTAAIVAAAIPGIRTRLGVGYVSPEVHMAMVIRMGPSHDAGVGDAADFLAMFRGVMPGAFLVHPEVRIVAGRAPSPANNEIMVGSLAATRLGLDEAALAIGKSIWLDGRAWTIVGRFEAPGSVMDSEIWCPLTDLQILTRRDSLSCVVLTLGEAEFEDVDAFCKQRLDLELVALRESAYYAKMLAFFRPIRAMVWATAGLIALGGLLGGLNTMYAAFASRVREMATLQTLGFTRRAIVISLVQESVLATAVGALIAAVLGILLLDGLAVRFSLGAFGLRVDAGVILLGLSAGIALGVVGVLPPAWRCLRLPVTDALRTA